MYERLGEGLETLCRTGRNEALIVAPFIKRAALERLLVALPSSAKLLCVTRWRPEEVAAGVSDPDIWHDIQQREGAMLRLCPSLHAKYYRVDNVCLIGSANVTATALGWSASPNLEILCPFGGDTSEWQQFERQLTASSVLCHEAIYQEVVATAALLKSEMNLPALLGSEAATQVVADAHTSYDTDPPLDVPMPDLNLWLPQSRQPSDLYLAYSEQWSRLTSAARLTALVDLKALQVPPKLPQPLFDRYVAMQLLQVPSIASVDGFVRHSQRFGAVTAHLRTLPCAKLPQFNPTHSWQTLMRWLLYFLPERYERTVPNHSEIFQVRKDA